MTWKPRPRMEMDLHTLPLDPRQGYLLSLLDGSQDVPALAAILNTAEAEVSGMLAALVACGAVVPDPAESQAPAPAAALPGREDLDAEDPLPLESATHRQLFEQRLHAILLESRKDLTDRGRDQDCLPWQDIARTIPRFAGSARSE